MTIASLTGYEPGAVLYFFIGVRQPIFSHSYYFYRRRQPLLSRYSDAACLWLQLDVEGLRCSAPTAQRSTFCGVYALRPLVP